MVVGQVGFKESKKVIHIHFLEQGLNQADTTYEVKRIHVPTRENPIVNRLNKTKVEEYPDLRQQKEDRDRESRRKNRAAQLQRVSHRILATACSDKKQQQRIAKRGARASARKKGESMAERSCLRRSPFRRGTGYVQ